MANAIGVKAAAKSLASQQGKLAIAKLMDGEPVDLNDIFKAVLTDGPNALNSNANDIVKLVQEEKAPTQDSVMYDAFDYIKKYLAMRKQKLENILLHESHGLKPDEIEVVQKDIQICGKRDYDLIQLKEILKYHLRQFTRPSILHWLRLVFIHEWSTATMTENHQKYSHVLVRTQTQSRAPSTKTTTPRGRSKNKKFDKKYERPTKIEKKKAQARTLEVFKEICWYHNWRKQKCIFDPNCNKAHICSIEGCGSKDHRAMDHK